MHDHIFQPQRPNTLLFLSKIKDKNMEAFSQIRIQRWVQLMIGSVLIVAELYGQSPSDASLRINSLGEYKQKQSESLIKLPWQNVGPTIMSGRVVDVEVDPGDPTRFYVAYASGGVWRTENNGQSFTPIFDEESTMTIGDIAIDWAHGESIWIGTGENNSSRSSYAGTGTFYSNDKGKTWSHKGLEDSHHIGKVLIHPNDPKIIWVAVLGHLYTPNVQRGIFKSVDGGNTWQKTLYVGENSGAIDMVIDPKDPNILYASVWQRDRKAWNFNEAGSESGIYKSTNAGETWNCITKSGSGFLQGDKVGRIGLAISNQNSKILYAVVDDQNNQEKPKPTGEDADALTNDMLRKMSKSDFEKLSKETIEKYLEKNRFPDKYDYQYVVDKIKNEQIKPTDLADYLEDANAALFNKPVKGAQIYKTLDGGITWKKTHAKDMPGMYFTYGYYFGRITISPADDQKLYVYGYELVYSEDGGKSFKSILKDNVHVDFHSLWVNPKKSGHIISGNDGGLNISYDNGATWFKANSPAVGQFYTVGVDSESPYNVYGGMQDNGVWRGPSTYTHSLEWTQEGVYPYKSFLGGDGMQVAIDTLNKYLYTGYQFGHYFRINLKSNDRKYITPSHELGEARYRWNWQTPILISRHNPGIVFMGSNHLHRSMDFGNSFPFKSNDLTNGGKAGDVPYGTLTCIEESPLRFGMLYTGSDDGKISISFDAGFTWKDISQGLPSGLWVSRIVASKHDMNTVYISLNGYRSDHFEPYIFMSKDAGDHWVSLAGNLPKTCVNVIREDPKRADILYIGTDNGMFFTSNGGQSYQFFGQGLPRVAVHDIAIQAREQEIILGTHGRSLYKGSLKEIQSTTDSILNKDLFIFNPDPLIVWNNWGKQNNPWESIDSSWMNLSIYAKKKQKAYLTLMTKKGDEISYPKEIELNYGIQNILWKFDIDPNKIGILESWLNENNDKEKKKPIKLSKSDDGKYYPLPGKYQIKIRNADASSTHIVPLVIKKPGR